ncbi:MAG: helix-turn-helix domain-containing protein [Gemmatimonadetes bacterium]|nr:helix-turn-helix domain-containing protein [Gemmatimonadota bacterium]
MVHRLQHAAGRRFGFLPVRTWEDAVSAVLRRPVELAVVDASLEGQPRAQGIERLNALFPSLPLILYTALTAEMATVFLQLGRSGIRRVLVERHDDHPSCLADALVTEAAHAVSRRLIEAIGDLLAACPRELRWAIETVLREPAEVQSVKALAERARMDRRTCVRWFARAHLPPPSDTLMALRVVYAHRLLQDPGYTVEDVATRLGYGQTRSLTMNMKDVLGMTPGEARVSLTPEGVLHLVRQRYFARAAVAIAEAS